jgi:hypothetical protein
MITTMTTTTTVYQTDEDVGHTDETMTMVGTDVEETITMVGTNVDETITMVGTDVDEIIVIMMMMNEATTDVTTDVTTDMTTDIDDVTATALRNLITMTRQLICGIACTGAWTCCIINMLIGGM